MRSIMDRDPEYDHDAAYYREEEIRERDHRYRDEALDDEDEPSDDDALATGIDDGDFINHGEYPAQPYEPRTFAGLYGRPSL